MPAYKLSEDYTVYKSESTRYGGFLMTDLKVIPKDTFLRPFWNKDFVPKDVREGWAGDSDCVYCYTFMGIYPIPNKLIVEA